MKWFKRVMLIRPPLALLGFLMSYTLVMYTQKPYPLWVYLVLSVGFMNMYFTLMNDIMDMEDDKKNPRKWYKPLPSGAVKVTTALVLALSFFVIGMVSLVVAWYYYTCILWGWDLVLLLLVVWLSLFGSFIYNVMGRKGVFGNIMLGIAYGGAVLWCTYPYLWLFAIGFGLSTVGFNLGVQIEDIEYDRKSSVPRLYGIEKTVKGIIVIQLVALIMYVLSSMYIFVVFAVPPLCGTVIYYLSGYRREEIFEITNRYIGRIGLILALLIVLVLLWV